MVDMKEVLTTMMRGWMIREASWDNVNGAYTKDEIEAMTEACDGDRLKGETLYFFSHWSNDIQSAAAHYGIAIIDGKVVDIPAPPTPDHWWDCETSQWREPFKDDVAKEAVE